MAESVFNRLTALSLLLLGAAGCGSVPPADLAQARFDPIRVAHKHTVAIVVDVAANAVSRRAYGSGSPSYQMPYVLGDVEQHYAKAVASAVFASASTGSPDKGVLPTLRLVFFSHSLITHTSGSIPDVTDEVTARWVLFDPHGAEVARYVFIGQHSAATGFGGRAKHYAMAQARGVAALDDLYRKTVEGLSNSSDFDRSWP